MHNNFKQQNQQQQPLLRREDKKHCQTCTCNEPHQFFHWRTTQRHHLSNNNINNKNPRISRIAEPRIPANHSQVLRLSGVGPDVLPNRTIWFRSLSPRPNKIVMRISSPNNPSYKPSSISQQKIHRRNYSSATVIVQNSPQSQNHHQNQVHTAGSISPFRQLFSKTSFDSKSQLTSPQTDRIMGSQSIVRAV